MKHFKQLLALICSLVMVLGMALTAAAAEEAYTYTVRIYAGAQGVFTDASQIHCSGSVAMSADTITISGLKYGERINIGAVEKLVTLNNGSKYYVRGIRESGKDNNTISTLSFDVRNDMDYVVGYGLANNLVEYTVMYLDTAGNELAPSNKYYGNVGDSPVIAFQDIDGYVPQSYNLTGELYADASQNVYAFIYLSMAELEGGYLGHRYIYRDGEVIVINRGTTFIDGGTEVVEGGGGNGGNGGNGGGAGGNGNAIVIGDGGDATAEGVNGADAGGEVPTTPAEITDIRDDASALAEGLAGGNDGNMNVSSSAAFSQLPLGARIAGVAGALSLVGLAAYFLIIRKATKKNDK